MTSGSLMQRNFDFKLLTKRTAYKCFTAGAYIESCINWPFRYTNDTKSQQQYLLRHSIEGLFQINKCHTQFPVFCEILFLKLSNNKNCICCTSTWPEAKLHFISVNCVTYDVYLRTWSCNYRSSPSEVFYEKGVPKICSIFTGEHPCQSVISIKLQSNFMEMTLWHVCSFSCKFTAYFQNTFYYVHLWVTASVTSVLDSLTSLTHFLVL